MCIYIYIEIHLCVYIYIYIYKYIMACKPSNKWNMMEYNGRLYHQAVIGPAKGMIPI